MLLKKILHTTSILAAFGALLGSACPSPVWAMDAQESLPEDVTAYTVRQTSKIKVNLGDLGEHIITDWKTIRNCRFVSHSWKAATDQVIRKDNLLAIKLSPENYMLEGLEHMASLTTTIYLVGWSTENSRFIDNALSQENASLKKFLAHASTIYCCQPGDPARFTSQDIGDEGVTSLGSALKNMTQLKSLSLHSSMKEKSRQSLFMALPCLTQLNHLFLDTVLGEEGGEELGKILPRLTNLEHLNIRGSMGPLGTKEFTKGLSSLQKLKNLMLLGNGMGDIGLVALADQLELLTNLEELQLDKTATPMTPGGESRFIREAGEKHLLKKNKTIYPYPSVFLRSVSRTKNEPFEGSFFIKNRLIFFKIQAIKNPRGGRGGIIKIKTIAPWGFH